MIALRDLIVFDSSYLHNKFHCYRAYFANTFRVPFINIASLHNHDNDT